MFGAGILGLPYAVASLGWVAGLGMLSLLTAASCYSAFLLAELHTLRDGRRMRTLRMLGWEVLGSRGGHMVRAFQFTEMLAALLVYTIAGASALMGLVHGCYGAKAEECSDYSYNHWPWAIAFGGAMVVLAQVPDFHRLTGISMIGAVAPVLYATTVFAALVAGGPAERVDHSMVSMGTPFATAMNVFQGIGAMAFCFGGQTVQNEVTYSLRSPPAVLVSIRRALSGAYAIIALAYFAIAVAGFAFQGNSVPGNILLAIPSRGAAIAAQICVLLQVGAAYNVYGMGVYHAMEDAIQAKGLLPSPITSRPWLLRLAVRSLFVSFFTMLAAMIPFFNQISGLNGGLTMIPLCFIFPILMYQIYHKARIPMWRAVLHWTLITAFAMLAVVSTFGSVYLIVQNASTYELFA